MKRLNLPMFLDILFYGASAFFLSLCILRYYRLPLSVCLWTAALIFPAVSGLSFLILYRRNKKKLLSKKQREARDALLFHFALEKPERVRAALLEAYLADGKDAHCEKEELSVDGVAIVPLFSLEPVSADEIARLIRRFEKTPFIVACKSLSVEAEKLLASFGLKAQRGDEIFDLFSRTEKMPETLICGEIPRKTFRKKLHGTFSKSNARPFFVSGVLLLIMSLFVIFPVYYLTVGSVLLLCAICVRLLGYSS